MTVTCLSVATTMISIKWVRWSIIHNRINSLNHLCLLLLLLIYPSSPRQQALPSIQEAASVQSKSPEPNTNKGTSQLSDSSAGRESPSTATSTAKSSRRDSLSEKVVIPTLSQIQQQNVGIQHNNSYAIESSAPKVTREYGKGIAFEIPKSGSSSNR